MGLSSYLYHFSESIVLIAAMGEGVKICNNVSIKICPNWAEEGRVKANWDNAMSLNLGVFFKIYLIN